MEFPFRKIPKKRPFLGIFPEYVFPFRRYLFSSCRLTHRRGGRIFAVFSTRKSKKRRYFGNLPCAKKLRFFGRAKAVAQKNSKKSDFFGESFGIHFVAFFFFVVMFFHCAFWDVHDFRRTVRKNGLFSCPEKMTFFRASKNAVFFGPRLPDDGPKKSWLSRWLAGYLAGWLTRWLRWLAGYLAIGFVAGWLAIRLLAIWLAGWLAAWHWLSGWLSEWLALWLAIWLSRWLVVHLAGWLAIWLGDWVVACSLAG